MVALGNVQKMGRTDGSRVDTVDTATQHFINIQCEHSHNWREERERERAEMVAPHKYYLLLPPHWQEDKLKLGIKIYIICKMDDLKIESLRKKGQKRL